MKKIGINPLSIHRNRYEINPKVKFGKIVLISKKNPYLCTVNRCLKRLNRESGGSPGQFPLL